MFKPMMLSHLIAGLMAVIIGFTSSAAIILQAAAALSATSSQMASWLLALGIGMGITCIGFSLYYRIPILTAWSTPGAALLATSLAGISMAEAIGAFIISALLIFLSGVTGFFAKIIAYIPRSLAAAMLAGILFHFGVNIFVALQQQFLLVGTMFITYLVAKHWCPRLMIFLILFVGIALAYLKGLFHLEHFTITPSALVFTAPIFSFATAISISIPLFIVTMTSQNIPGIAILKASGYQPPVSSLMSWTGISNLLLAPFGGFSVNLAAITAAVCLSEDVDPDATKRYKATIYAGFFYIIAGLFGATIVTLFAALPQQLILALAGLALLSTLANNLKIAVENSNDYESALITFLVSASGISLGGIGSAFWGLIAGILSLIFLHNKKIALLAIIKTFLPHFKAKKQT